MKTELYDYVERDYRNKLERYIKEVAEDDRNFKYLVITTHKAGDYPDFILVGQKGNLMIAEGENIYQHFSTDRYIVKYPIEINGIDQAIDLEKIRRR